MTGMHLTRNFKKKKKKKAAAAVPRTFLIAVDLVRAVVLAVVEVVAAEDGADAAAVGALELIFLAYGCSRRHFWKQAPTRSVSFFFPPLRLLPSLADTYGS